MEAQFALCALTWYDAAGAAVLDTLTTPDADGLVVAQYAAVAGRGDIEELLLSTAAAPAIKTHISDFQEETGLRADLIPAGTKTPGATVGEPPTASTTTGDASAAEDPAEARRAQMAARKAEREAERQRKKDELQARRVEQTKPKEGVAGATAAEPTADYTIPTGDDAASRRAEFEARRAALQEEREQRKAQREQERAAKREAKAAAAMVADASAA